MGHFNSCVVLLITNDSSLVVKCSLACVIWAYCTVQASLMYLHTSQVSMVTRAELRPVCMNGSIAQSFCAVIITGVSHCDCAFVKLLEPKKFKCTNIHWIFYVAQVDMKKDFKLIFWLLYKTWVHISKIKVRHIMEVNGNDFWRFKSRNVHKILYLLF